MTTFLHDSLNYDAEASHTGNYHSSDPRKAEVLPDFEFVLQQSGIDRNDYGTWSVDDAIATGIARPYGEGASRKLLANEPPLVSESYAVGPWDDDITPWSDGRNG